MMTKTYSQKIVLNPAKYTMQFAQMNASGQSTPAAGSRDDRGRSGSCLRSTARDSAAIAYMITVAEVTSPTRPAKLGKGRNVSMPTTKAMQMETNGAPRLLTLLMIRGK